MKNLPHVSVDRTNPKRLFEQVYKGFRDAITSGFYNKGDVLPARDAIAKELCVSETVVRKALGMLMAERLLVSRPKIGFMVVKPRKVKTFERVLIVTAELSGAYAMSVKTAMMEKELVRAGYWPYSICLDSDASGHIDCADLKLALEMRPDFVVIQACPKSNKMPVRLVERAGCPYLLIGSQSPSSRRKIADIHGDYQCDGCIREFVDACRRGHIRNVCQVGFGRDSFIDAEKYLSDIGIYVERLDVDLGPTFGNLEAIQHASAVAMRRRLKSGALPDLFFFVDDYLTLGALPALLEGGVRVPDDVKVVTFANRGFGPVFTKSFARIEVDMRKAGVAFGKSLVAWLKTGDFHDPGAADIAAMYIPGETFPGA
jgi:DNA-binding LacI/PurR family transcriptional regulator